MSETAAPPMTETASPTRRQTALMKRLAKMRDHKDFEKANEHVPPTEELLQQAAADTRAAGLWLIGTIVAAMLFVSSGTILFKIVLTALGLYFVTRAVKHFMSAQAARGSVVSTPLLRTPALVADRRSETTSNWFGGRTIYYFRLELEDGTAAEYRYPGRGVQDDLLVKGMTGVAYLRGDTLIAWKTIKV